MEISKEIENLVLFTYAVYPLRIAGLRANDDPHDELGICERLIELKYLRRNDYGVIRLSDNGFELLADIYINYRRDLLNILDKRNKHMTIDDVSSELSINTIHRELWIAYFLKKLKVEKVITDFSISDNGNLRCWFV